jgi:hypothetical protein
LTTDQSRLAVVDDDAAELFERFCCFDLNLVIFRVLRRLLTFLICADPMRLLGCLDAQTFEIIFDVDLWEIVFIERAL